MNDDVRSALDELGRRPLTPDEAARAVALIRWVYGEPARLAAALERANEGVRYWTDLAQAEARDAAALRARVAELEAEVRATKDLAATVVAIREARVAELEKTLKERDEQSLFEGEREHLWNASFNATVIDRTVKAEAQVAAARAECERVLSGRRDLDGYVTATDVLRAMDEAKP